MDVETQLASRYQSELTGRYALQSVVVLVSPAHHLNKGDLYFTLLATAIR